MLINTRIAKALPWLVWMVATLIIYQRFSEAILPDAIAYLSVTEKILAGSFTEAVNGYWSPLISWVLVPFCAVGIPGLLAFQIVNLLLAVACLHLLGRLLAHYNTHLLIKTAALCGAATLLPFWAIRYLTADLLFLTILLAYIAWQLQNRFYGRPLVIAAFGGLLYLSKAYGLPFFLAHSVVVLLYRVSIQKMPLRKTLAGFALALVICGVWVLLISGKYQRFTISEAGPYNRSIISSGAIIHPCDTLGLLPTAPGERYFAWEEMTRHVAYPAPATGITNSLGKSLPVLAGLLMKLPRYGLALLVFLLAASWLTKQRPRPQLFIPLSALLIFTGGYCLLFVEERYLLFTVLLLVLLVTVCAHHLLPPQLYKWSWLPALLILYIQVRPVVDGYRLTNITDETNSAAMARQLAAYKGHNRSYASWFAYQYAPLAYYNNWKDMGGLAGYGTDSVRMKNALQQYRVDFLILPPGIQLPARVMQDYDSLPLQNSPQVKLLRRRQ